MSIEKLDGQYQLTYYSHGLQNISTDNIEDVNNIINEFIKDSEKYIIQQGIRLLKYMGSPSK